KTHLRGRIDVEEAGGIGDHISRRARLVVGEVDDIGGVFRVEKSVKPSDDVVAVNAVEDLPWFDQPTGEACSCSRCVASEGLHGIAAGAIDSGEAAKGELGP
ncbi:MAG: hypothetical protein AAFR17_20940, partial [Pseudomonadota bacterium]